MLLGVVRQCTDLVVLRSLDLILLDIVTYDADKFLSVSVYLLDIDARDILKLIG